MVRENSPPYLVAALLGSGNRTALSWVGCRKQKGWETGWKPISHRRRSRTSVGWSGECRVLGYISFWNGQCPVKLGLQHAGLLQCGGLLHADSQRGCLWAWKGGHTLRFLPCQSRKGMITWMESPLSIYRPGHWGPEGVAERGDMSWSQTLQSQSCGLPIVAY